ncbi:MAG: secondary thiamine-phosphate synthase enzyme YjbQ [Candidatus Nezhaarchaeota archaeon]|nr:secondary thiamine-phosphate synthase enzyme YjbQ [Candidatus Nezhaarchaeota archaeon]
MKVYFEELDILTSRKIELVNITKQVEEAIRRSNVKDGLCLVYVPHATATVIANEDEPGLRQDITSWLEQNFPANGGWKHNIVDDNASAHLASAFISPHLLFPVRDGNIIRGAWQQIILVEMDGPRRRRVLIEVMGT